MPTPMQQRAEQQRPVDAKKLRLWMGPYVHATATATTIAAYSLWAENNGLITMYQ